MWEPSTSASAMMMTLWYRSLETSKSVPMPAPSEAMTGESLSLFRTLSILVFSTLSILPQSGRMAWMVRSRPILAEPPAESPSTM